MVPPSSGGQRQVGVGHTGNLARNLRYSNHQASPQRAAFLAPEGGMHYRNSEMKLDQIIGYFNGKKINLIPPFQRGHVWGLPARRRLLENMVKGRPIPAIFLYKEAAGS